MSQTTTKIAKPDPLADAEAIAQFKARFSVGRANELTDARDNRSTLQKVAVKAQDGAMQTAADAKLAKQQWTNIKTLREKKSSPPPANQKEIDAKQKADDLELLVAPAKIKAEQCAKDYADADRQLEKLERQAYKEKVRVLVKRLKAAGKGGGDVEKDIWAKFNTAIAGNTLPDFENALVAAEKTVIETVSDVELEPRRAELGQRLEALAGGTVQNDPLIKSLKKTLATADLFTIEKTLQGQIAEAEEQVGEFGDLKTRLIDRTTQLKAAVTPKRLAEFTTAIEAADKSAVRNLPKAIERLGELEKAIEEAEGEVKDAAEAKLRYPKLLKSVEGLVASFPDKGFLPGTLKAAVSQAATAFSEGNFPRAAGLLSQMEVALKTQAVKASARVQKLTAEAEEAAVKAEEKRLADEQRVQDEAEQLAREQAMVPESLDAIGRDNKFGSWFTKVKDLLDAGLVTMAAGAKITLGGGTIEVPLFVDATGFRRQFVIHYHPGAGAADINNPYASAVHVKPFRGNKNTPRVYLNSTSWVFTHAPKLNQV